MTQENPMKPSQNLVDKWVAMLEYCEDIDVFTDIAQWGADQELEACCEWLVANDWKSVHQDLFAARRPAPPTKKEALDELFLSFDRGYLKKESAELIRRALESLPD